MKQTHVVKCPTCKKQVRLTQRRGVLNGKCGGCKTPLQLRRREGAYCIIVEEAAMEIEVTCPHCRKITKVARSDDIYFIGNCENCDNTLSVTRRKMHDIHCPDCNTSMSLYKSNTGHNGDCPTCSSKWRLKRRYSK